jgi:hypothetical protein
LASCGRNSLIIDQQDDGDTFVLANSALESSDPVTQSWVAYSLAISACQLRAGGENPARATSFNCEVTARRLLLDKWDEIGAVDPSLDDAYLVKLDEVQQAGFLSEYVVRYFRQRDWELPDELNMHAFRVWSVDNLYRHQPQTQLTGTWSFEKD